MNDRGNGDAPRRMSAEVKSEVYREWIKRVVDTFPPLTPEQKERLSALLRRW